MMEGMRNNNFPVAIIGIGCRLPGRVTSTDEFWEVLRDGRDCISEVPADRWSMDTFYNEDHTKPDTIVSKRAGFIDGIDKFDNTFFKTSPREAASMDPQQRVLMEVAHEAFEDAGIIPDEMETSCGVFVGVGLMDYPVQIIDADSSSVNAYTLTGTAHSVAANRISYAFDLKGPSYAVDTACASSMTALHLACCALWNGECSIAVVGGANAVVLPDTSVGFSSLGVLSPDGKSSPFSDTANGYVRSEGWGSMILKPLDQAMADSDHIYATIIASSVGASGYTQSLTMPSSSSQQTFIEDTYRRFGIDMDDVEYLEAHGTGTPVGDPIEAEAIGKAFRHHRKRALKIGSVKSNFGHCECSAGAVSTIKATLMLYKGYLVPSINYENPNPMIDLIDWNLEVQTSLEPLLSEGKKLVGINSFGFAGALAHAVLQEAPRQEHKTLQEPVRWSFGSDNREGKLMIVPLSAKSTTALEELASKWMDFEFAEDALHAIGWQATHRKHHECRLTVSANSGLQFRNRLHQFITTGNADSVSVGTVYDTEHKICFVFPGQGQQWENMGRQLYATEQIFRDTIKKCDDIFRQVSGWSLINDKYIFNGHCKGKDTKSDEDIDDMEISQPAIVFLQIGLYELWRHWGLEPDAVVGHSLGEVAAAYACGGLTLTEAVKVIYYRSKHQASLKGAGSMVAVRLTVPEAEDLLNMNRNLYIAAENAPGSLTLAGSDESVNNVVTNNNIKSKQLRVQCAFHTPYMDPIEKAFRASMIGVVTTPAQLRTIPFYSTLTGNRFDGDFSTEYWWKNIRHTVKFQSAVENILRDINANVYVECGASATLLSSVKQIARGLGNTDLITVTSGQRQQDDRASILNSLGQLYTNGIGINWKHVTNDVDRWVDIPKYPWQHGSFWIEGEEKRARRLGLDDRTFSGLNGRLTFGKLPFLADYIVHERAVFPAAGCVEYALQSFFDIGSSPVVKNVRFKNDLTWPEQAEGSNPCVSLKLKCVKDGSHVEVSSDGLVLSSCEITSKITKRKEEVLSLNAIRERCNQRQTKDEFYNNMSSLGFTYGPAFQVVDDVMVGDGEIIGSLRPAEDNKQRIQTTQLDGCFQLLLNALGETTTLFLPVSIDNIEMHVPKLLPLQSLVAYAKITECNSNMLIGDITLSTTDGHVLANISGVHCKNITGTTSDVDIDKCLYETCWQPFNACMGNTSILRDVFKDIYLDKRFAAETDMIQRAEKCASTLRGICASYIRNGLNTVDSSTYKVHPRYIERLKTVVADVTAMNIPIDKIHDKIDEVYQYVPELKQELEMIKHLGDNFTKTLSDPGSAVKILFRPEFLPNYFIDSLSTRLFYEAGAAVVTNAVKNACKHKKVVRVLEIGGRMGGLARHLLEPLKELGEQRRFDYIFTDLSVTFFMHAQGTLEEYQFVKYQQLDIEKDIVSQGFVPGSVDLIVSLDTIHSYVDINHGLQQIRDLLTDDGMFLMYEATNTNYIAELVFGSLELCWVFQDFRTEKCWMSRSEWSETLTRNGFTDVVAQSTPGEFFHTLYLGKKSGEVSNATHVNNYMFITDGVESELEMHIKNGLSGKISTKIFADMKTNDFTNGVNEQPYEIIYIWSEADSSCHSLLKLLQTIDSTPDIFSRVWVVTSGSNMASPNVDGSKAIGLTRAVTNTCNTPLFSIDIDPNSSPATQAQLFVKYVTSDNHGEREVAIRNDTYLYPRLTNVCTTSDVLPPQTSVWQLTQNSKMAIPSLDDMGISNSTEMIPSHNKVSVRIKSAALNIGDTIAALGRLDENEPLDDKQFGIEFSGIVDSIGKGVTTYKVGDEVMGFGEHCFASHTICDTDLIVTKPHNMSWEKSAGVPIAFASSYHSLVERANLQGGETVLIHSACGGVGLSAIQVAKMIGANIICSAGTQKKRRFLMETLGIKHVTDSRSSVFYNDVMEWTDGKGVDVVLNSLHGDLLIKGIECLALGGRFCDIGKRDKLPNSNLQLLIENKTFISCQLYNMMKLQKPKVQKLLKKVSNLLGNGTLQPIICEIFPITDYQGVFPMAANGLHIGKIIFNIPQEITHTKVNPAYKLFKQDATYIITGAFCGIGLAMSRWIARRGANYIIMVSKRGCQTSADKRTIEFLRSKGVNVQVFAMDLSKPKHVKALFEKLITENVPSIKGIFHLEGYTSTESLHSITDIEADNVISTKAASAQLLHTESKRLDIDLFVTLSSVAATSGHWSEPMFIAANNFLDALAENRRKDGLPSLSIQLGPVRGPGIDDDAIEMLALNGHHSLHMEEFLETFACLLQTPDLPAVVCIANQDWNATQTSTYNESLKYRHLALGEQVAKTDCSLSLNDLEQVVTQKMSKLLCVDHSSIDINRPMINYGVDSLMAVELVTWASKELNVVVSQLDILGGITTKVLLEKALNKELVLPLNTN